jgi:hypothetical protein
VPEATRAFFEKLGERGHDPLLAKAKGSARFEVVEGGRTERWLVTIDRGDLTVSRRNAAADCVVRADRATFDRIAAGRANFLAAALRGEVALRGDLSLLVLIQRLFPRPAGGPARQPVARAAKGEP